MADKSERSSKRFTVFVDVCCCGAVVLGWRLATATSLICNAMEDQVFSFIGIRFMRFTKYGRKLNTSSGSVKFNKMF